MSLSLHTIKSPKGSKKDRKRVGRGNASSGTYSGRGMKGQRSRSGGKSGLKLRGFKQNLLNIPKKRGFTSIHPKMATVNIGELEITFDNGAVIDPGKLQRAGLVRNTKNGVKILSVGKLTKKFSVTADSFSAAAKEAITKAGGTAQGIKKEEVK